MKKKLFIRRCVASVFLLTLSVSGQTDHRVRPTEPGDALERQVPGNDTQYNTAAGALLLSVSAVGVPGGVASRLTCEGDSLEQLWLPLGRPLGEVLNTIVAADSRYTWRTESGVANPSASRR